MMEYMLVLAVVVICLPSTQGNCYGQDKGSDFQSDEKKLFACLLYDYNPDVRAVKKENDTVQVTFGVATIKIADIDEKNHLIKLRGWNYQTWNDPQLTWDKEQYGGIESIRIPINKLWKPDIVMYNYEEAPSLRDESESVAIVKSDGSVVYVPISTDIKASCKLDFSKFPHDTQNCVLVYGSWTNTVSRVNITVNTNMSKLWYTSKEWTVTKNTLERKEFDFGEEYGGIFAVAMYTLTMKRNPVYYTYMFVLPSVLIAFLTVFMYLIPPETGERLTMGSALIISLTVMFMMLENHLPSEVAEVPLLLRYMMYDLFMVSIALMFTVMGLNFHHRDVRKGSVPRILRKMFLGKLPHYLCMEGSVYSSLPTNDKSEFDADIDDVNAASASSSPRDLRVDKELTETSPLPSSPTLALEKTLDEIRRYLRICAAKATLPEPVTPHKQLVLNEWHHLALVVDRLLFFFFGGLTVLVTIGFYSQ